MDNVMATVLNRQEMATTIAIYFASVRPFPQAVYRKTWEGDFMVGTDLMTDGSFGVEEAQSFSGLGRTFLYELMTRGELPYTKVGARRLIPKRALVELLAKGLTCLPTTPGVAPATAEKLRRRRQQP
jgi:excisionase family DNA binding protein